MDKYEYKLKLDQMKSFTAENNYKAAAEIADTINWHKIKNVNALIKAGEIYENVGRYEESRDILLMAYDRSPIGRMIIYRLAEVAIKMGNCEEARDYYQEFVEIAPHDNLKYVLRYEISKAEGADLQTLIGILEELKEQEYSEEWAFELACLYHKAGMSEKCIDACDELILWFGDGPYVERALELKMLYQPLTRQQEEKYRQFRLKKEGVVEVRPEDDLESGEIVSEPVQIPKVKLSPERFNTQNLQDELRKNMVQIMEATDKEKVEDSMDTIKKLVEEIPYLQIPKEEPLPQDTIEMPHIETDAEIDNSLKSNFKELLAEDYDGQISMYVPDKGATEPQVTGQMSIDEVLADWEKTKRAAETALEEAKQRKLESAKARALQEAGDIMDRLTGVLPKLDAVLAEKADIVEETMETPPQTLERETPPEADDPKERKEEEEENKKEEQPARDTDGEELWPEGVSLEEMVRSQQKKKTEAAAQKPAEETSDVTEDDQNLNENRGVEEMETETETKKKDFEEVPIEDLPQKPTLAQEREEEFAFVRRKTDRSSWKGKTIHIPQVDTPVDLGKEEKQNIPLVELTDEQKAIFSYFMPVKGMEDQLCKALKNKETASRGNLVIKGGQGSGKTTLATSMIKVLQQETGGLDGKIGKIHAEALNQKNVGGLLDKVAGGCLIIEQAGDMEKKTVSELSGLLDADESGLFVILEDTSKGIKRLFAQNETFAKKFSEQISVPIFTNDELVTFARSYSRELGYKIDDMAVLALYNRISNIQRLDQATTLTEVKDIVDEAIHREAHGGLKKAISILTASRYTDDDRIVLTEKDFE